MSVAVVHIGARRYYALPRLFYEAGLLSSFHTDIFIRRHPAYLAARVAHKLGAGRIAALLGRHHPDLRHATIRDYRWFGLLYWLRLQSTPVNARPALYARTNRRFNKLILKKGLDDANIIYAFQGGALELFQFVGSSALKVLDQNLAAHGHVDKILAVERQKWPGWENMTNPFAENPLQRRQRQEWKLADLIVAPSNYAAETIRDEGAPHEKIVVIPYPSNLEQIAPHVRDRKHGRLRILFLGSVNLRKGVPYLLEAASRLGPEKVQVRLAGPLDIKKHRLEAYGSVATFLGPLPRAAAMKELAWADVLCLPSLGEGQALVTNEALASGAPVVCTYNTGSQVRDGIDGSIVPIRDIAALSEALDRYVRDPAYLRWQSEQALAGRDRLGYQVYRRSLLDLIQKSFQKKNNQRRSLCSKVGSYKPVGVENVL